MITASNIRKLPIITDGVLYIYLQDADNAVVAPACGLGEDGDVLLHHHVAPHRAGVALRPAPAQALISSI